MVEDRRSRDKAHAAGGSQETPQERVVFELILELERIPFTEKAVLQKEHPQEWKTGRAAVPKRERVWFSGQGEIQFGYRARGSSRK